MSTDLFSRMNRKLAFYFRSILQRGHHPLSSAETAFGVKRLQRHCRERLGPTLSGSDRRNTSWGPFRGPSRNIPGDIVTGTAC